MRTENEVINTLMESSVVRDIGLTKDSVRRFVEAYKDSVLSTLLRNGYVCVDNDMRIDIVRLTKRIHVLRGKSYESSREYKLKLSIGDTVHGKIREEYIQYEE